MATTKKTVSKPAAKKAAPATKRASAASKSAAPSALKPLKEKFTKPSLVTFLSERADIEPKKVKLLMQTLEETMLAAVHKKGIGEFTLPGLVKITSQTVPAKKRRFGKDPFTGEERWFDAKPASVRVKVRPLKKLKDAAA